MREHRGKTNGYVVLKGQCQEIFDSRFFHESISLKPMSVPLGPFSYFLEIRGDICSWRCTTHADGKWKKSSIRKASIILFGVNILKNFVLQVHFQVKVVWYCSHICHRSQIYCWWLQFAPGVIDMPVANFPRYQWHQRYRWENLPRVLLIPVVHLDLKIFPQIFRKIWNDPNVIFMGLGEDDSRRTWNKNLETLSL